MSSATYQRHFPDSFFDGPFFLSELTKTFSYVVMLSGALLDQARLFEQVALDGRPPIHSRVLSNYPPPHQRSRSGARPLAPHTAALQCRASRHGRPQDHQRPVTDHLTGKARALVAYLQNSPQSFAGELDTAARYGGDEFALVLPEAGKGRLRRASVFRIRERLSAEPEHPALSVSAGFVAAFPEDGDTPEKTSWCR